MAPRNRVGIVMDGVREYDESEDVRIFRRLPNGQPSAPLHGGEGRVVIRAYNEGGYNSTSIDLDDLLEWVAKYEPKIYERHRSPGAGEMFDTRSSIAEAADILGRRRGEPLSHAASRVMAALRDACQLGYIMADAECNSDAEEKFAHWFAYVPPGFRDGESRLEKAIAAGLGAPTGGTFTVGSVAGPGSTIVEINGERREVKAGERGEYVVPVKRAATVRMFGGGGGSTEISVGPTRCGQHACVEHVACFQITERCGCDECKAALARSGGGASASDTITAGASHPSELKAIDHVNAGGAILFELPNPPCGIEGCGKLADVRVTFLDGWTAVRCHEHATLSAGDTLSQEITVNTESGATTSIRPGSSPMSPYYDGMLASRAPKGGDQVKFTEVAKSKVRPAGLDGVWIVEHVEFDLQAHTATATLTAYEGGHARTDVRNLLPPSFEERDGARVTDAFGTVDWWARGESPPVRPMVVHVDAKSGAVTLDDVQPGGPIVGKALVPGPMSSFADLLRAPGMQRMLEEATVEDAIRSLAWCRDLTKDLPPTEERSPRDLRDLTPREVLMRGIAALRQVGSGLTSGDASAIADMLEDAFPTDEDE